MRKLDIVICTEFDVSGLILAKYRSIIQEMMTTLSISYKVSCPYRCFLCDIDDKREGTWFRQNILLEEKEKILFEVGQGRMEKAGFGWIIAIDTIINESLQNEYETLAEIASIIGLYIKTGNWHDPLQFRKMYGKALSILNDYNIDSDEHRDLVSFQWLRHLPNSLNWPYYPLLNSLRSSNFKCSIYDLISTNMIQHWEFGDHNGKFEYQSDPEFGYWQDMYDDEEI